VPARGLKRGLCGLGGNLGSKAIVQASFLELSQAALVVAGTIAFSLTTGWSPDSVVWHLHRPHGGRLARAVHAGRFRLPSRSTANSLRGPRSVRPPTAHAWHSPDR